MQQHNNNNNLNIADQLSVISSRIKELDKSNVADSIAEIHKANNEIELIAKDNDLPTLLAVIHCIDLSTELNEYNSGKIEVLLASDSYSSWIDVFVNVLEDYSDSQRPLIHRALTSPNWVTKPSNILLKNVALWIATIKKESEEDTLKQASVAVVDEVAVDEISIQDSVETLSAPEIEEAEQVSFEQSDKLEYIDTDIIEKDYQPISDESRKTKDQNVIESESTVIESITSEPIDEEIMIPFHDFLEADTIDEAVNEEFSSEIEEYQTSSVDLLETDTIVDSSTLNDEVFSENDTLITSLLSSNTFHVDSEENNIENKIESNQEENQLQTTTNEVAAAEEVVEASELTEILDNSAEELAETKTESARDHIEEVEAAIEETNTSGLRMTWDDDTHPELLMVYLEETPNQIHELLPLLNKISEGKSNKEDRVVAARLTHTIKGGSAVVGIEALANLSSHLEIILEHSVDSKLNEMTLSKLPNVGNVIQSTFDNVQLQLEEPNEFSEVFSLLEAYSNDIEHGEVETEEYSADLNILAVSSEMTETDVDTEESDVLEENIEAVSTEEVSPPEVEDIRTIEEDGAITSEKSDFKLTWDDDTHPELLMVYLEETPTQITEIVPLLNKINQNEANADEKHTASRMAHTIKGGSAIVGITALQEISYRLETILDHSVKHQLPEEILKILPQTGTCLENLFEAIQMQDKEPSEYFSLFKQLDNYVETINNNENDDQPLELPDVVLPDFILNQNTDASDNSELDDALNQAFENEESTEFVTLDETNSEITEDEEIFAETEKDVVSEIENTDLEEECLTEIDTETNELETQVVENEDVVSEIEGTDAEEESSIEIDTETSELETEVGEDDNIVSETEDVDTDEENSAEIETETSELETELDEDENVVSEIEDVDTDEENSTENETETNELETEVVENEVVENEEVVSEIEDITTQEDFNNVEVTTSNAFAQKEEINAQESVKLEKLKSQDDVNNIINELNDIVMNLITYSSVADNASEYTEKCSNELQRFELITDISGYPELSLLGEWCQSNLDSYAKTEEKAFNTFIKSNEIWSWIEHVSDALRESDDMSHMSSLSVELMREDWLLAIKMEDLQTVLLALRHLEETSSPESIEYVTETNDDNEVISWDKDVHPELLAVYFKETPDQIDKVAGLLHKISRGESTTKENKEAARIAHTIKGSSGVVGLNSLLELTHHLEDILDYSVNNEISSETGDLLSEASDCMESLFETIQNKQAPPDDLTSVIARLSTFSGELDQKGNAKPVVNTTSKTIEFPNKSAQIEDTTSDFDADRLTIDNSAAPKVDLNEAYIRVPIKVIDKLLNLAGELVTTSSQVSDNLEKTQETNKTIRAQDERVHNMLSELNSTIIKQEKDQQAMLSSLENSDFDSLEMDTYNELQSVASLLSESIMDSQETDNTLSKQLNELSEKLHSLEKLNKSFSDVILSSRMITIDTIVPRLERIVRQTCRKTNKKAQLVVTGNHINIDTDILNNLVDPLLHMLRNSIDHGIETPEFRQSIGKDESGLIELSFSREGNHILMSLKDDGAGINPEKIYQKAIEKELITPDQEFSDSDAIRLILQPGFTTQETVTDISGRGVGMDVVNTSITDLNGSMDIDSKLEEGTTFNLSIPLTLITNTTLLVKVQENTLAIPTDIIEQILYLEENTLIKRDNDFYVPHAGKELKAHSLGQLLSWPHQIIDAKKSYNILIIKTNNNQLHAIHIDDIVSSREVVVKPLSPWISPARGVVGACHLNDGGVAPVINLKTVVSYALENASNITLTAAIKPEVQKNILVVDDSLSNRKALSLIIEKTEYNVLSAVDGLDALQIMNKNPIDLVFTDLEMPRMNGLELTQSIRAWNDKKETPIVMITSRTTTKHRELAKKAGVDDYLTKPVVTEILLKSIDTWLTSVGKLETTTEEV